MADEILTTGTDAVGLQKKEVSPEIPLAGYMKDGKPFTFLLVASAWQEPKLISLAYAYEEETIIISLRHCRKYLKFGPGVGPADWGQR